MAMQPKADCGYPVKAQSEEVAAARCGVPITTKVFASGDNGKTYLLVYNHATLKTVVTEVDIPGLITAQCPTKFTEETLANGDFYTFQYSEAQEAFVPSNFPRTEYVAGAAAEVTIRGGQQIICNVPITSLAITSNTLFSQPTYIKFTTHADWVQGTHLTMPATYDTRGTFTIAESKSYLMTVVLGVYSVEELTAVS